MMSEGLSTGRNSRWGEMRGMKAGGIVRGKQGRALLAFPAVCMPNIMLQIQSIITYSTPLPRCGKQIRMFSSDEILVIHMIHLICTRHKEFSSPREVTWQDSISSNTG